jgi:hypothetical protein
MLRCVEKEEIDVFWPVIVDGMGRALETSNGECTIDDIKAGLTNGTTRLLFLSRNDSYFGMVVQILAFPRFKIARVMLGFGKGICLEKSEWKVAEKWAKEQGCKYLEAWVATESRARMFRRFGFKKTYQIIRSEEL